jgi:hypothetical protein
VRQIKKTKYLKMNYWQPPIDNWLLKEADAGFPPTTSMSSNASQDHMAGGVPVKSEEEEDIYDKLSTPYKGILTLNRLKEQINQVIGDIYNLSKVDKDNKYDLSGRNPYEAIKTMLDNPDLKAMLDIASEEIKKRLVSI